MEKRRGREISDKVKKIVQTIVCITLLIVIWVGYAIGSKKINQTIDHKLADDFSWVVQVDTALEKDGVLRFEGFAFRLNMDAKNGVFDIVLHDLDTGEYLYPNMEYLDRKDVNDFFLCDYDYTKSGFVAKIKKDRLHMDNDYEFLLKPRKTKIAYQFMTYLSDGMLVFANPKEYIVPDVKGTYLEEIVNNGVLRLYEPKKAYVFQNDGDLYWLFEADSMLEEELTSYVEWHLETTQIGKLPKERLKNSWYFDNLGFYFADAEIDDEDNVKYRVARRDIPELYAVSHMRTGQQKEGMAWLSGFRPYFELGE